MSWEGVLLLDLNIFCKGEFGFYSVVGDTAYCIKTEKITTMVVL